jgi:hypothetical protein
MRSRMNIPVILVCIGALYALLFPCVRRVLTFNDLTPFIFRLLRVCGRPPSRRFHPLPSSFSFRGSTCRSRRRHGPPASSGASTGFFR